MNGRNCPSSDIITSLPQNLTEDILTRMPIRDAVRTSILSSKWRYSWTTIPTLVFNYNLFEVKFNKVESKRQRFFDSIFQVLLLHKGPILRFHISVDQVELISKFDQIIHYFARRNDLKALTIRILRGFPKYKLPTSFFSLQGLEYLRLRNCDFKPPLTFDGFRCLQIAWLTNVQAHPKMLQSFLSNCPLLREITLMVNEGENYLMNKDEYADYLVGRNTSTFVEFLPCVPLIQILRLTKYYMKYMAAGGMPYKLSTSLVHLKDIILEVCLMEQYEISSVLCIIMSSPKLKNICFLMYDNEKLHVRQTSTDFLDPYLCDLNLNYLEKLAILRFSNLPLETEFVKLIMAKSPVLKNVQIELSDNVSANEELKTLKDFLLLPFPRAPTAKLTIERRKPSS